MRSGRSFNAPPSGPGGPYYGYTGYGGTASGYRGGDYRWGDTVGEFGRMDDIPINLAYYQSTQAPMYYGSQPTMASTYPGPVLRGARRRSRTAPARLVPSTHAGFYYRYDGGRPPSVVGYGYAPERLRSFSGPYKNARQVPMYYKQTGGSRR